MNVYRRIVIVVGIAACGVYAVVLAQITPYTPSSGGSGSVYTPLSMGSGGAMYDSYVGTTGAGQTGSGDGMTTGSGVSGSAGTTAITPPPSGVAMPSATQTSQSDLEPEDNGYGYAEDFASDLQVINDAKKPLKEKKKFLGFSTVGNGKEILRNVFSGSALGASWRVLGAATDPVAQGTLTGKGSLINIAIGLYTGSVRVNFISKAINWVASFYSDQESQYSELYNGKSGIYQEEASIDMDGMPYKLKLLLVKKTIFGAYESELLGSGSFFIVDTDALPEAAPALWAGISIIPYGNNPLIPTEKIIELLTRAGIVMRDVFVSVAHAVLQPLTPAQIFDRLGAYKKVLANMQWIEQKFASFDFNDPELDYDAVQKLVDAYDADQQKLDYLVTQLGRARLFVRGGDWLSTGGDTAYALMDAGVDMVPAVLVSQVSGPFDFYTVQTVDGKDKLFAGTCTGRNDPTTDEQVACVLRKPTAAQSKAVLKANGEYLVLASQAHDALGNIESALFAPAE